MAAAEHLESYLSGKWARGEGIETNLTDPVHGTVLATASARGLDLDAALQFARARGGPALRALGFAQRAKLLGDIADVLSKNRANYESIAIANSGNTRADAAIDIDGGIGTLKYYARLAAPLGDKRLLRRRQAGAPEQGGKLPGHAHAGAAPRRRDPHQRV